jgi:CDP-diacylglycerol---serine O-phosphatidyltransferase
MPDSLHKRKIELPFVQLLPNLMTVTAICAGLTAIRFGFQGSFQFAVILILFAAILDGLDGRVARLLKSESALGAELDSLADFLNFGVAPALLLYAWAFQDMRNAGWIAVIVYTLCCVMRLARFNIGMKANADEGPATSFIGVPSPAGAFLVMLPLFVAFGWPEAPQAPAALVFVHMIVVGLLMVSRVQTWKLKSVTIYREHVRFQFIAFVGFIAALLSYPWATLVLLDIVYIGSLIWTWNQSRSSPKKESP